MVKQADMTTLITLKNRVIDELLERGDIKMGVDPGEIKITEQGKNKPEY
jgi:hypothetical protein